MKFMKDLKFETNIFGSKMALIKFVFHRLLFALARATEGQQVGRLVKRDANVYTE